MRVSSFSALHKQAATRRACSLVINLQGAAGKDGIYFDDSLGQLYLKLNSSGGTREEVADISNGLKEDIGVPCSQNGAEICRQWADKKVTLTISPEKNGWRKVTWLSDPQQYPKHINCFSLGKYRWFGGPEQRTQLWPVDQLKFSEYSYVTKEADSQSVAEPVWFNSKGIAVIVEKGVPLFIDQNSTKANQLCLIAKFEKPYRKRSALFLSYKIGYHVNAREAFLRSVNDVIGKPTGIPDQRMIESPIWSTWALYKQNINETIVRSFAKDILKWNFTHSQLEIDDNWEACYGTGEFNKQKFPDIARLIRDLHRDNFRVTLWTHPFVNTNCNTWQELQRQGYFVSNGTTKIRWWNGEAGLIDFTDWRAAKYWEEKTRRTLKESGIDSLKFDAGETSFMPSLPSLSVPDSPYEDYPSEHASQYLRTCAKFGNMAEYRTAHRTQDLPIFLRMTDKDTHWGINNGLKSIVTSLLQLNMVGYSFVLPDMIGGNVYGNDPLKKELFIRWLQANTFMPALQYSRVPWEFDNTTIDIARKYADLHRKYAPVIIDLMKNTTTHGTPVNPPIWWNDPTDETALAIDSEYMLGDNILVAPVLEEGVISRDIYLPAGKWIDQGSSVGKVYNGKTWIRNYPASLDVLPYFVRSAGGAIHAQITMFLVTGQPSPLSEESSPDWSPSLH